MKNETDMTPSEIRSAIANAINNDETLKEWSNDKQNQNEMICDVQAGRATIAQCVDTLQTWADERTRRVLATALIVTDSGKKYQATVTGNNQVEIAYMDGGRWVWAGSGKWDGSKITDCAADLGDDVYSALDEAVSANI